jgi:hypothetical protein
VFSCSPTALVATKLVYEFITTYRVARILHLVHRVASEVSNGSTAIRCVMSYDRGDSMLMIVPPLFFHHALVPGVFQWSSRVRRSRVQDGHLQRPPTLFYFILNIRQTEEKY